MRLLFLAAAALIALAPVTASAHRGVDHATAATHSVSILAAPTAAAAPAGEARAWSNPCPGGAGGKCCCENHVACSGSGTPPAIAGCGFTLAISSAQAETLRPLRAALPSRLAHSPSLARAPPVLS